MSILTFILLFFLLFLSAVQVCLHLPLPDFGQSGLQDGLPLFLQSFPLTALICCLKDECKREKERLSKK